LRQKTRNEAMDIADHLTTDTISWSEDWSPTDCEEDDSLNDEDYIRSQNLNKIYQETKREK